MKISNIWHQTVSFETQLNRNGVGEAETEQEKMLQQ